MERQRSSRGLGAARALALAGSVGMLFGAGHAHAQKVLILGQTVTGAAASLEHRIITTPTTATVPGTTLLGLGLGADIATPADWATKPYASYEAIVFGDPSCVTSPAPLAAAVSNTAAWTPAVTGNVVIIGTDPTVHPGTGTGDRGAQLWRSAIAFAVSGAGTGAVISLSCYYHNAATPTSVSVLNGFGAFTVTGVASMSCSNAVSIVATSPALTGLSNTTLSGWGCSVHEWFNTWHPSFIPLAISTDVTGVPPTFTAADGTRGHPYILARGDIRPIGGDSTGIVKVCKVAGTGVAVGTPFTFTAGGSTLVVPAGPAPGGYCAVGPALSLGATVTVTETIPPGYGVSSIAVAPPGRLVGTPDLGGGTVTVRIGSGVTEVTFTDEARGYLEICKRGEVRGSFSFTVSPGNLGPFVVPAGACSPPIQVPAGTVVIRELPAPGIALMGCSTYPASRQGPCNLGLQTSTVTVAAGDVSAQTVAIFTNRRTHPSPDSLPASRARDPNVPTRDHH